MSEASAEAVATPPVRIEEEREFPVTPRDLWRLLANTEHLNRTIGLPPVTYGPPVSEPSGVWREARARFFGLFPSKWREYPFEWVQDERYSVLRVFESGPLTRFLAGIELSATVAGTRVKVFADLTPRGTLGRAFVAFIGPRGVRDTLNYCESFVARVKEGHHDPVPRDRTRSPVDEDQIDIALRRLRRFPVDARLAERLATRLREGTDEEVVGMRPYVLAEAWKADRHDALKLFLYAVKAGLLTFSWESVCPNCRVPKSSHHSLTGLEERFTCDLCAREYAAELDRSVELRLSVHPAVRKATRAIYCMGGPANSPHVVAQRCVAPGASAQIAWPPGPPVRLRALRSNALAEVAIVEGAPAAAELTYDAAAWSAPRVAVGGPTEAASGGERPSVTVRNASADPLVVVVEQSGSDPRVATAAEVTSLSEFRDLFREEVLAAGRDVTVEQLSVMFIEVMGCTELCARLGDAAAFDLVLLANERVASAVRKHRGTVVKTLGDGSMAVFPTPELAVRAAVDAVRAVREWTTSTKLPAPVVLRLGVHHGPGIAVGANGGIDYFGRTVNVAARLPRLGEGNDVVLTAALAGAVREALSLTACLERPMRGRLPGEDADSELLRLIP